VRRRSSPILVNFGPLLQERKFSTADILHTSCRSAAKFSGVSGLANRQRIDRFSRSCTAQRAESPYSYNGLFFPPKIPFPMGYLNWTPWFPVPARVLNPNSISISAAILHTRPTAVSVEFTMGRPFPPQNCLFWDIWTSI